MTSLEERNKRDEGLIQATIKTWQPYFTHPLNKNDAEEIIHRWSGFLNIVSQSLEGKLERSIQKGAPQ